MSLLIAAIVVFGFAHTIDKSLLRHAEPRPLILRFHAVFFSVWVAFDIFQAVLVRTHNVRLHRQIGWFGAALGAALPLVGIPTVIFALAQIVVMYTVLHNSRYWRKIAHAIVA